MITPMTAVFSRLGGRALGQGNLRSLILAAFFTELGVSMAFPLRLLYAQAHHATPTELGMFAGVFFLAPVLFQMPLGWLVDRWGRVPVLLFSMSGHTMIGVAYIFLNSPAELICLRFVEGMVIAGVQPASAAYIADVTAEEHRAEAYGVLTAALSGGLLIGPLFGGLVGQQFGFVSAYALSAAVEAVSVVLVLLSVREPARHRTVHAEERALPWSRFLTPPLLGAYAVTFTTQIIMGIFSALWTIRLHDLGGSYTYLGFIYTVFAVPGILLGAIGGRAADRWGIAPTLLRFGILIGLIYIAYGFVTNLSLIPVVCLVEGIFLAFQAPAQQALLAAASPSEARGRAQGIAGLVGSLGGAGSAFFSLSLYHWNRPAPFVISGTFMAAGAIAAALGAVWLARHGAERAWARPSAAPAS
jgi:DHA1 family multidrug resistance protein-like MFS transporter